MNRRPRPIGIQQGRRTRCPTTGSPSSPPAATPGTRRRDSSQGSTDAWSKLLVRPRLDLSRGITRAKPVPCLLVSSSVSQSSRCFPPCRCSFPVGALRHDQAHRDAPGAPTHRHEGRIRVDAGQNARSDAFGQTTRRRGPTYPAAPISITTRVHRGPAAGVSTGVLTVIVFSACIASARSIIACAGPCMACRPAMPCWSCPLVAVSQAAGSAPRTHSRGSGSHWHPWGGQ